MSLGSINTSQYVKLDLKWQRHKKNYRDLAGATIYAGVVHQCSPFITGPKLFQISFLVLFDPAPNCNPLYLSGPCLP